MDKDKVCVHPWSHIAINPNGDVWPCCHQRWPHAYTLGNMHEKTIEQIFNDKPLRKLRKRMLAGELPNDVCNKCVEYEKLNVMSPRQIANKETYAELKTKTRIVLKHQMTPIFCSKVLET